MQLIYLGKTMNINMLGTGSLIIVSDGSKS